MATLTHVSMVPNMGPFADSVDPDQTFTLFAYKSFYLK